MIIISVIIVITVIIIIISTDFSKHNGSLSRQQPRAAGVYLVDELHVASEALQGLLADAGLPQEHGEVIRARH